MLFMVDILDSFVVISAQRSTCLFRLFVLSGHKMILPNNCARTVFNSAMAEEITLSEPMEGKDDSFDAHNTDVTNAIKFEDGKKITALSGEGGRGLI